MALQTGHVGLNVTDLERSRDFYQWVFGLEVLAESDDPDRRFAFLANPDVDSEVLLDRLAITLWQQSSGRFQADAPGLHHLAFHVSSIEAVEQVRDRLRDMGVTLLYDSEVVPHSDALDSGGIFFEDPDGTRLEVCAPSGARREMAVSGAAPSCGFF